MASDLFKQQHGEEADRRDELGRRKLGVDREVAVGDLSQRSVEVAPNVWKHMQETGRQEHAARETVEDIQNKVGTSTTLHWRRQQLIHAAAFGRPVIFLTLVRRRYSEFLGAARRSKGS